MNTVERGLIKRWAAIEYEERAHLKTQLQNLLDRIERDKLCLEEAALEQATLLDCLKRLGVSEAEIAEAQAEEQRVRVQRTIAVSARGPQVLQEADEAI